MISRVYDPIRRRDVALKSEEGVRQALLHKMIHELGYPRGLIAVEREFGEHRRRFDIVCYGCGIDPIELLSPILVVECKASVCSKAALEQAMGYNAVFGAPFLCIAGKSEIVTLWRNADQMMSVPFLPSYHDLLAMAKQRISDAKH
jgi:hypothetical protein